MLSSIEDFNADLGELKNKLTGVLRIGIMDSLLTDKNFLSPAQSNDSTVGRMKLHYQ
jgi:hypothetical protein